jgi:hypothetical protein
VNRLDKVKCPMCGKVGTVVQPQEVHGSGFNNAHLLVAALTLGLSALFTGWGTAREQSPPHCVNCGWIFR